MPRLNTLHSYWVRHDGALFDAYHHTEFADRLGTTIEDLIRARWLRLNISPRDDEILVQGRPTAATRPTLDALRFSQCMSVVDDDGRTLFPKPEEY